MCGGKVESRLNNRSLYLHKDTPKAVYKSQGFDNMAFEYKFKITKNQILYNCFIEEEK